MGLDKLYSYGCVYVNVCIYAYMYALLKNIKWEKYINRIYSSLPHYIIKQKPEFLIVKPTIKYWPVSSLKLPKHNTATNYSDW